MVDCMFLLLSSLCPCVVCVCHRDFEVAASLGGGKGWPSDVTVVFYHRGQVSSVNNLFKSERERERARANVFCVKFSVFNQCFPVLIKCQFSRV